MKIMVFNIFVIIFSFTVPVLVMAQSVEMLLNMSPGAFITIEGETLFPLESQVYQFTPFSENSSSFINPDASSMEVFFFADTTDILIDLFISSYNKDLIISRRPLPTGLNIVGSVVYNITAFDGLAEKKTFNAHFSLRFHYTDEQVIGFDEETLRAYFFDESQGAWTFVSDFTSDQAGNSITVSIDHLTLFALLGEPEEAEVAKEAAAIIGGGPIFALRKIGDANNDGKVDIFDFNILMIQWGKIIPDTMNNIADFDKDGLVGIFDFNILMVHWFV